MKLIPRSNQILGRTVIERSKSNLIVLDQSKVTKFLYVDAVGESVKTTKIGDIVLPDKMFHMSLGKTFRPFISEENVRFTVAKTSLDEFLVQINDGTKWVPFDSEEAAQSLADTEALSGAAE